MEGFESDRCKSLIVLRDGHVPWHVEGDHQRGEPLAHVRGYAIQGESFIEGAQLAKHIHGLAMRGVEVLQAEVPRLNGGWAFVVQWPSGEVSAAVDRMRTIPLFYYHDRECFAIADSAAALAQRFSRSLNLRDQFEFLLFMYVTGGDTLYEGVRQLQSGEMLAYQPGQHQCSTFRYYRFYPSVTSTDSAEALSDELAGTLQRMFERFRDGLRGKRVVIPLSGGLDSRLVAGMLKRVGIGDCVCYTYGQMSDEEVRLSRQVAEELGFTWRFVEYSPELCARWNRSEIFPEFMRYGCKGAALPSLHDYPAVMQLAEEGLQGENVVYFPGHSADMNAGSHIPPDYADILAGKISPRAHILRGHGRGVWEDPRPILKSPAANGLLEKIDALSAAPAGGAFEDRVACCEMWNAEQRQSKYIINSVRTYEFVGARWRTLWDYEFMDFFLRVPVELRYGQKLYLASVRDKIFVDELAGLARIPLAKHGPLTSLSSIRGPASSSGIAKVVQAIKRKTYLQLLKAGLARQHLKPVPQSQLIRIRFAGLGIPAGPISVQDTLERLGALEWLGPDVQHALKPWLTFSLDSLRFRTVYTIVVLAEMSKDAHSKQDLRRGL